MDDTILALTSLLCSCSVTITTHTTEAPVHIVIADIDPLLALVHSISTKLALALKPTAPAYTASIPLIHDLTQHVTALAYCTRLLRDDIHGATLAKHIRGRVGDIIGALRALAQAFLDNVPGTGSSGEEFLVRTGVLHDLITNARSPSGIPKDNRAAVSIHWKSDMDSLEDNLHEITRLIDQAESDVPDTPFDDGWDELGLGDTPKLDKDELARAKNVHQFLRFTTLLHKRILVDLFVYPSSAPVSAFDALLIQSNRLLATSDDLVAALYSPQDPTLVRKEILELVDITTCIHAQIPLFLPAVDDLAHQLGTLNLGNPATPTPSSKKRADKKWFDTCADQILRLCARASESDKLGSAT